MPFRKRNTIPYLNKRNFILFTIFIASPDNKTMSKCIPFTYLILECTVENGKLSLPSLIMACFDFFPTFRYSIDTHWKRTSENIFISFTKANKNHVLSSFYQHNNTHWINIWCDYIFRDALKVQTKNIYSHS